MTTTIENLHTNKRKFISDGDIYPPLERTVPFTNQVQTSCNAKKSKSIETEGLPSSVIEIDDNDNMMICENSNLNPNDTNKEDNTTTNKSKATSAPKHCNGICNADASPTTLSIRCYCDPYRLNALIPYNSDIY